MKKNNFKIKCINCKRKLTVDNFYPILAIKDNLLGYSCKECKEKGGKLIFGRLKFANGL